jgi:uncharacterized protein YbaR (Trm112 family)
MKIRLLDFICCPLDQSELQLIDPIYDSDGDIFSGLLVSKGGNKYPIRNGIPRFVDDDPKVKSVISFGDEWNYFNFDDFESNWLTHTIKNTFGTVNFFNGKLVVDCGAGSGMQTKWIHKAGAEYVIALEMSHAVDDVISRNLKGLKNIDIVQCSIENPPFKKNSINGVVICHNVIQHTSSVENTAHALWDIVGNGEFVFNCYPKNDKGILRKIRLIHYYFMRYCLSKLTFKYLLLYSKIFSVLRFIPLLGLFLEKSLFMVRGDVPKGPNWYYRAFKAGVLNTFDAYGSHKYQHLKSNSEITELLQSLVPKPIEIKNFDKYFSRPQPIGIALRLLKKI